MKSILLFKGYIGSFFIEPLKKLFDEFLIKSLLSTFLSLWAVPAEFAIAFFMMWVLDMIIGSIKSVWGRKEKYDVDKLIFSVAKFGAYSVFLIGATFFANTFKWGEIQRWAFAFVILTEFASITRHVFGDKAGQVLSGLRKVISAKTDAAFGALEGAIIEDEKKS